jgi:hypothetical protein
MEMRIRKEDTNIHARDAKIASTIQETKKPESEES